MKHTAFWLHYDGEVIPVETIHIATVIRVPEKFGYTFERIKEIYSKYGEPIGHEGRARHEIMSDIIRNYGWIRIRYRPRNDVWVVELHSLTDDIMEFIIRFLNQPEVMGQHPHADIRINELFRESERHHNGEMIP